MSAEYFSEETTQPQRPLSTESNMFARIGQLAHGLGVSDAGVYFRRTSSSKTAVLEMLATSREADGTLFFACNRTARDAYSAGTLKRTMDAFLVDTERRELAYLKSRVMFYGRQEGSRRGEFEQGPMIEDTMGMVGISYWRTPQLELQPVVSSPQPDRLEYEKSPVAFRAGILAHRLGSLSRADRQERLVFPVGM